MTAFVLKLIALATMTVDHLGAELVAAYGMDFFFMRIIGRVAFPIYCFLIAEGCRKTSNIRRYLLRLLAFALISEPAFNAFFNSMSVTNLSLDPSFFMHSGAQNVFFTLGLGAASVYGFRLLRDKSLFLAVLPFLCCAAAAEVLKTDYGMAGVALIFCLYHVTDRARQAFVTAIWAVYTYAAGYSNPYMGFLLLFGALAACLCIYCYNGRRGVPQSRGFKYAFYAYYPLHLLILACVFAFWTVG